MEKGNSRSRWLSRGSCLSTECWSRLSSLGTQGTPSHPPWASTPGSGMKWLLSVRRRNGIVSLSLLPSLLLSSCSILNVGFFSPILSLPTALLSLPLFCLALCEPLSCVPAEFLCPDTTDAEGQDWNYSRCNLHFAQGSLITSMIKYN